MAEDEQYQLVRQVDAALERYYKLIAPDTEYDNKYLYVLHIKNTLKNNIYIYDILPK